MSIATYDELKQAIASWLDNGDMGSRLDDFVTLAEARLNRELRLRAMETDVSGTAGATITLPADFLEIRRLAISYGGALIPLKSSGMDAESSGGTVSRFYISGGAIHFDPAPSGESYTLTYYAKIPALSAGTNWLIENAPDLYLYASLLEASPFIRDAQALDTYGRAYASTLQRVQAQDAASKFSGPLQMRSSYTV